MRYFFSIAFFICIVELALAQKVLRSKFYKADVWYADTSFVSGIVEDVNDTLVTINQDQRNLSAETRSYLQLRQIKKIKIIRRRYSRINEVAFPLTGFASGALIGSGGSIKKFEKDKSKNLIIWSVSFGAMGYLANMLVQDVKSVKLKPQKQNLSGQLLHEKIKPYSYRYQIEQYKMKLINY